MAADSGKVISLTPTIFYILLALIDHDRHGYGIIQQVARDTDNQINLGAGTLYGSIKRMLEASLIEEAKDRPAPEVDDPRRIYYHITALGRAVAMAEAKRLAQVVQVARDRHLLPR